MDDGRLSTPAHHLQNVEADGASEVELEEDDGALPVPHPDHLAAVVPSDHLVLRQLQCIVHTHLSSTTSTLDTVVKPTERKL